MGKAVRHKFLLCMAGMILLVLHSAAAAAISFQIIQRDPSVEFVRPASVMVENVLFDCFFEEGHIATNYPTVVSAGDAEDKSYYYSSLDDAKKSFCNYFVVLVIYYDVFKSKNPEAELLSNISSLEWKLFNTGTSSEIADGKRTSVAFAGERNRGIDISSFTSSIAKDIIAALRAR